MSRRGAPLYNSLPTYVVCLFIFPDTNILCRITSLLYPSCIYTATLIRNCSSYSDGDKICLFGFSRGGKYPKQMPNLLFDALTAHTARAVMGMLYKVACHHLAYGYTYLLPMMDRSGFFPRITPNKSTSLSLSTK